VVSYLFYILVPCEYMELADKAATTTTTTTTTTTITTTITTLFYRKLLCLSMDMAW